MMISFVIDRFVIVGFLLTQPCCHRTLGAHELRESTQRRGVGLDIDWIWY